MITSNYYYTFGEVLKAPRVGTVDLQSKLIGLVTDWNDQTGFNYSHIGYTPTTHVTKLINDYLLPRYWKEVVVCMPCQIEYFNSEDYNSLSDDYIDFLVSFVEFLKSSSVRYDIMINLFETNKNKLLDNLKSTNVSRYNDTPQNEGSFEDTAHNSSVTINESNTPIATSMINKLNEVNDKLRDVYEQWSLEFENRFVIWSA